MENYTVYKHTNKSNGKSYVGITKQKPERRWGSNGKNYKKSCPLFWCAIEKYGWDGFIHEVICEGLSKEDACVMGKQLIKEFKLQDRDWGYNMLEGGNAPELPEEVRHKMSMAMKGNKNGLGKPCSDEKREKIKNSLKGKEFTEEHKKIFLRLNLGKSQHLVVMKRKEKFQIVIRKTRYIVRRQTPSMSQYKIVEES